MQERNDKFCPAAGTSPPELIRSVVACSRAGDMAVGNVVGSNIFSLPGVLGLSPFVSETELENSPGILSLDFPVMLLVAVLCLPICLSEREISRAEGIFLCVCYGAYTTYLIAS